MAIAIPQKTYELYQYLTTHGGRASGPELMEAFGLEKINPIMGRINSLVRHEIATYEKVAIEGVEKPVGYVTLNDGVEVELAVEKPKKSKVDAE